MAYNLIWSPAARDDLHDITVFIAHDNSSRVDLLRRILKSFGVVFVLMTVICSWNATTHTQQNEELRKQIEQIAADAKGHVGVAAEVLETGEAVALNPAEHFPMQSVYKLPIGMAVLAQVDDKKLFLEQQVRVEKSDFVDRGQYSPLRDKNPNGAELSLLEMVRFAVSDSDSTASDVLLKLIGVRAVTNYLHSLGINEIVVANTEREIGAKWETQYRNWASPRGALQLLRSLHERRGVSEQHQQLLLKFMIDTPRGTKRLKSLLPETAIVAHKPGTSGTNDSGVAAATNDIGLITLPNGRHLAIAMFVSDSRVDLDARERVIARIAKAAWDHFSRR